MTVSGECTAAACLIAQSSACSEFGEPSTPTTIPGIACSFRWDTAPAAAVSSRHSLSGPQGWSRQAVGRTGAGSPAVPTTPPQPQGQPQPPGCSQPAGPTTL